MPGGEGAAGRPCQTGRGAKRIRRDRRRLGARHSGPALAHIPADPRILRRRGGGGELHEPELYGFRSGAVFTRLHGTLDRGDVVLVRPDDDSKVLIKRVVGLPGEEVYIDQRTGAVMIDGEELEEAYIQRRAPGGAAYRSIRSHWGKMNISCWGTTGRILRIPGTIGPVSSAQIKGEILVILRKG